MNRAWVIPLLPFTPRHCSMVLPHSASPASLRPLAATTSGPGAPAALGMVTFFFAMGQALAPSVAGYLADVTNSFNAAFFLAAAVAAMGNGGSLTLRAPK